MPEETKGCIAETVESFGETATSAKIYFLFFLALKLNAAARVFFLLAEPETTTLLLGCLPRKSLMELPRIGLTLILIPGIQFIAPAS